MNENNSTRDDVDRGRLSVDAFYEVERFARENRISPSQVSKLIKKIGNDRQNLAKAVKKLRDRH
ncbi:DUF3606 domain-containing protein [Mesorhizobium sp. M1348]|uniref:DUF3606 domain-containing protein n=1 Tax=unclassified Mesorhizobium TaxID=325217 RepID=UPI00333CBE21